jgi:putative transposase
MAQSLVQIYVHIVFSTKQRKTFLKEPEFRDQTHGYLAGICKNLDCPPVKIGGVEDHVHILCRLGKQIDVSKLLQDLKQSSSVWIKDNEPALGDFYWQHGYGAFSVSPSHVDDLTRQPRGTPQAREFSRRVSTIVREVRRADR